MRVIYWLLLINYYRINARFFVKMYLPVNIFEFRDTDILMWNVDLRYKYTKRGIANVLSEIDKGNKS